MRPSRSGRKNSGDSGGSASGNDSIEGIENRWPNFFIVGAPKAGTTSLYRYLDQHPQIYMSPVKEPSFFSYEVRPQGFAEECRQAATKASERLRLYLANPAPREPHPQGIVADRDDYRKLFRGVHAEQAIGEASVCYLWSATAAANISAAVPGAKIIMVLRDPAERAFSQYLHNARDGVVRGSFREQVELAVRNTRREFHPLYPFLENGLYFEQVKRYLRLFPPGRIRIFIYEEAWRKPAGLIREIFEFLGVEENVQVDVSKRELTQRAPRSLTAHYLLTKSGAGTRLRALLPDSVRAHARTLLFKPGGSVAMEPGDRLYLRDYYREDVKKLANLLGRDLGPWLE